MLTWQSTIIGNLRKGSQDAVAGEDVGELVAALQVVQRVALTGHLLEGEVDHALLDGLRDHDDAVGIAEVCALAGVNAGNTFGKALAAVK